MMSRWLTALMIGLLMMGGVITASAQEVTPEEAAVAESLADPNGQFIEVDGMRVYVVQAGPEDGAPVLLLHGFLGSTVGWDATVPALVEAGYRVTAFDRPPFGLSDKRIELDYTLESMSRLTADLMDALGIEKAALVGHSAGGLVIADFALRYPERVEKLAFIAGAVGMSGTDMGMDEGASNPFAALFRNVDPASKQAQGMLRLAFRTVFGPAMLEMAASNPDALKLEDMKRQARFTEVPGWEGGLLAFVRDNRDMGASFDITALKDVTIPVLLLWGEEDRIVPIKVGERLRDVFPNDRWITLPGVGHMVMDEATDQTNAALVDFLGSDR